MFNGHTEATVAEISEEVFSEIQVMYADGILGTRSTYDSLAPITAALFNYLRPANSPAYAVEKIFPHISEYRENPDLELPKEVAVNRGLKAFMSRAKGFERFAHV